MQLLKCWDNLKKEMAKRSDSGPQATSLKKMNLFQHYLSVRIRIVQL